VPAGTTDRQPGAALQNTAMCPAAPHRTQPAPPGHAVRIEGARGHFLTWGSTSVRGLPATPRPSAWPRRPRLQGPFPVYLVAGGLGTSFPIIPKGVVPRPVPDGPAARRRVTEHRHMPGARMPADSSAAPSLWPAILLAMAPLKQVPALERKLGAELEQTVHAKTPFKG